MSIVTKILVGVVAFAHLYFLYLEMFRWTAPKTLKAFGMTAEMAEGTKKMAGNQGLYNGFLAAGLIWALLAPPELAKQLTLFFAGCVTVAGLYGAATVSRKILYVQAIPAMCAIAAALLLS
jgi:putative membrane protein